MIPSDYPGGAFDSVLQGGRAGGRLSIQGRSLVFDSGQSKLNLELHGAQISLGGAANRLVYFSHPGHPERSFYVSDRAILKDPALAEIPGLASRIQALSAAQSKGAVRTWLISLAAVAAIGWGLWALKNVASDALARQVPVEWESKLGDLVYSQIKVSGKEIEGKDIEAQLKRLALPLLKAVPAEGYAFKLHLMEDGSLNAFALPGGNVILNTGLVMAATRPEEILGVLGHECAHVTAKHSIKQMIRSLGIYLVVTFILGDATGLLAVLLNNSSFLLSQKFSRDFEREADSLGWSYLVQAGIDPSGLIGFFELIEKKQKESPLDSLNGKLNFLSTHPATTQRIGELKARLKGLEGRRFKPVDFDLKAFQELIRRKK